jgi:hypothetical protein
MTKPPNIEGEVSPPPSDSDEGLSSAPVNQMIQLDTDTQTRFKTRDTSFC